MLADAASYTELIVKCSHSQRLVTFDVGFNITDQFNGSFAQARLFYLARVTRDLAYWELNHTY